MSQELLIEIASSMRLLMRHAITAPQGAGVPPDELFNQIRKLDRALGKPAHKKTPQWTPKKSTKEAFNKIVSPPPQPIEPPTNGTTVEPKPKKKGKKGEPMLVLKNGKWSLKK